MGEEKRTINHYVRDIMREYEKDYGGDDLAPFLREPSASSLKEACIYLLESKQHSSIDIQSLNNFLNHNNSKKSGQVSGDELKRAIKSSPTFKRIEVFLKRYRDNPDVTTNDLNTEFVAWLVNFIPRPFNAYRTQNVSSKASDPIPESEDFELPEKIKKLLEEMMFNAEFLKSVKGKMLNQVLMDYDLMNNASFIKYREAYEDDIAMQHDMVVQLEEKVLRLEGKLRFAKRVRRFMGGFGLFLLSVDVREPSVDNIFQDLIDEQLGLDEDDILDNII